MASDSEDDYLYSESGAGSAQAYASAPGAGFHHAKDTRKFLADELEGHMNFDSPNVLRRLDIDMVDDNLVNDCIKHMNTNSDFIKHKETLQRLAKDADSKEIEDLDKEEDEILAEAEVKKMNYKEIGKRRERSMMGPLHSISEMIRAFAPATYEREWVLYTDSKLKGVGDTFSFPEVVPDFTICDVLDPRSPNYEVTRGKQLWHHRMAFVELKASSNQGIVGIKRPGKATDLIAQAADYARLHMSARPFQLFSIGLLIFGKKFCVAIFDRDGVEFSAVEDIWENFGLFVRVIRRLCCDMSPLQLGMDPNVEQLPLDNPISQACRLYSQQNIAHTHRSYKEEFERLGAYPTYSIKFDRVTYYTLGLPISSSLSLMGRGTTVWKVTDSPRNIATSLFIMKSAWRQSGRVQESFIYEHVKVIRRRLELQKQRQSAGLTSESFGSPEGLVDYSKGADVSFEDGRKLTTANLRGVSGHQGDDTTVLHRVLFKTIGRSIWEFDNFLELFLGIRAALAGHKFLADAKILHRDVSAGNILLSSDANADDGKRGFLTDFEFARVEDEQVEVQKTIAVPPIRIPDVRTVHGGPRMTDLTTRTHTSWTSVQRGAPMTGTVQFMAYELVDAMSKNLEVKHQTHHDVESFVWVIYYATLRRLAYVDRPLQDVEIPKNVNPMKDNFKNMFGYIDLNRIAWARARALPTETLFDSRYPTSFNAPLLQFYHDLEKYLVLETRQIGSDNRDRFGKATYDGLVLILDKVIKGLRKRERSQQS